MEAAERSRIYWFLSRLYLEPPDGELLEAVRRLPADPPWGALQEAAEGQSQESLAVEFTRLFRGIKEGYGPPPPYESLYREGRLMGESTLEVMGCYERAGFGIIEPSAGPQDHLGVELRFMALLSYEEDEARSRGDRGEAERRLGQQRDFLAAHLGAWLPPYCSTLAGECREDFYREVARFTEAFAASEMARLELLENKEAI